MERKLEQINRHTSSYCSMASNMHPFRKYPYMCIRWIIVSKENKYEEYEPKAPKEPKTFSHWGFNEIVVSASASALLSLTRCRNAAARLLANNKT